MKAHLNPDYISDPRLQPDFEPALFPRADGGDPPAADASDPYERRQIEFLAIYYRLNRCYSRLLELRRQPPLDPTAEAEALAEIQLLSAARDQLEDQYAPYGFIGEPAMDGVWVANVEFTVPPDSANRFSAFVSVPLPPDVEAELFGARPESSTTASDCQDRAHE